MSAVGEVRGFVPTKLMIMTQRDKLMDAAVRYVLSGTDGTANDRLRTASNLSGIPINLIEVEVKK